MTGFADIRISKLTGVAALSAIVLLSLLVYLQTFWFDFIFCWDDSVYVVNNPLISNLDASSIVQIFLHPYFSNYQPLTILVYGLVAQGLGMEPVWFHAINVLLHSINIGLVYLFSLYLTGHRLWALIVAFLFAVHPVHIESVAWVSGLKDVLFLMFFLTGLIVYLNNRNKRARFAKGLVYVLFICALLSKPAALVFPVVLMLIDTVVFGRRIAQSVWSNSLFLATALSFTVVVVMTQVASHDWIRFLAFHTLVSGVVVSSEACVAYGSLLLLPLRFSAIHFTPESAPAWRLFCLAVVLVLMTVCVLYRKKLNKFVLFGLLFFLVSLLPFMKFVPYGMALIAERYLYLPAIGWYLVLGWGVLYVGEKLIRFRVWWVALWALYGCFLLMQSLGQIHHWENGEVLFTQVVRNYPTAARGYAIRGNAWLHARAYDQALADYDRALSLDSTLVKVYNNRGEVYWAKGCYNCALEDFIKAVELEPAYDRAIRNRNQMLQHVERDE